MLHFIHPNNPLKGLPEHFQTLDNYSSRPSSTGNIFVQLAEQQCCVASWDWLLSVLPSRSTNFDAAKSKRRFSFLQHENLLRTEMVIRPTNNLNLQRNIVVRHVARKCCPYYWASSNFAHATHKELPKHREKNIKWNSPKENKPDKILECEKVGPIWFKLQSIFFLAIYVQIQMI